MCSTYILNHSTSPISKMDFFEIGSHELLTSPSSNGNPVGLCLLSSQDTRCELLVPSNKIALIVNRK
jgi:hypothetical protein